MLARRAHGTLHTMCGRYTPHMTQRFAVLGWGSLLWDDAHPDFNAQIGAWQYDGPKVPVEFSRISQSRHGALTLVLDPEHGPAIEVAWTLSKRDELGSAIEDLQKREGTTRAKIGYVHGREQQARLPNIANTIRTWSAAHNFDGVVWTDLDSNFETKKAQVFSVQNARAHLDGLSEQAKAAARLYIRSAPQFIQTPLRAALADFVA